MTTEPTAKHPWTAADPCPPELAARLIHDQFRDLSDKDVVPIGAGWDNEAYRCDDWIFRFPKKADALSRHRLEARVMPRIAAQLSIPVTVPERFGAPDHGYPHPFQGHRMVPGRPIVADPDVAISEDFAAILGRELRALHSVPVEDALALGVPTEPLDSLIAMYRSGARSRRERLLPAELLTALSRVLDDDRRFTISSPESPVLTHSDLHEEHILVDPASGRPSGIIDWSDLSIVDPAVDFVGLRHWRGAAFAEAVLEARGLPLVDPQSFQDRLETMTICVAAIVTDYGLHGDRPDCLTLGRRALERELGLLEPRSDPEPAAG